MLITTYRKHFVRLSHVYFSSSAEPFDVKKHKTGGVVFLHGTEIPPKSGVLFTTQNTLVKDLSLPQEELFLTLGKHLRQYIKRSEKENIVELRFYDSEMLIRETSVFEDCKKLFEKMYSDKGIDSKFNTSLAKKYCQNGALLIGVAYINSVAVGFSAVIYHQENARLWLTAFNFRDDVHDSQILSRAHQQLDWKLLLECKKRGVLKYDFGGVESFDEPNGIDQFKMNFERNGKLTYNNYLIHRNLIGKLALKVLLKK